MNIHPPLSPDCRHSVASCLKLLLSQLPAMMGCALKLGAKINPLLSCSGQTFYHGTEESNQDMVQHIGIVFAFIKHSLLEGP